MSDLMDERKMIYLDDAIDAICKHGTALERRGILVLALVEHKQMTIDLLESLPSAQPEIVRCKDCKYYTQPWYCEAWNNSPGFPAVSDEMFCSMAERRNDQ